jgi:hypothetical protein
MNEKGQKIIHVLNLKNTPVNAELEGFSGGSMMLVSTTENDLWNERPLKVKSKNGRYLVNLEPGSVNTIIMQ